MDTVRERFIRLAEDRAGVHTVEMALALALFAFVSAGGFYGYGDALSTFYAQTAKFWETPPLDDPLAPLRDGNSGGGAGAPGGGSSAGEGGAGGTDPGGSSGPGAANGSGGGQTAGGSTDGAVGVSTSSAAGSGGTTSGGGSGDGGSAAGKGAGGGSAQLAGGSAGSGAAGSGSGVRSSGAHSGEAITLAAVASDGGFGVPRDPSGTAGRSRTSEHSLASASSVLSDAGRPGSSERGSIMSTILYVLAGIGLLLGAYLLARYLNRKMDEYEDKPRPTLWPTNRN